MSAHRSNVSYLHELQFPRKRIATLVEHASNNCRVTSEALSRGQNVLHSSIRIGMSHAFLPDSAASLVLTFHLKVKQAEHAHVDPSPGRCSQLLSPCAFAAGTI